MSDRRCYILLSGLFPGTTLTPYNHFLIARNLRKLDLPINTIEHMLLYEVFPILWFDFLLLPRHMDRAQAWNEDWVATQAKEMRKNPGNLLYRGWMWLWRRYIYRTYIMEHWNGIKEW